MNFAEKLIAAGYKPINWLSKLPYDPKDCWLGVSVYHPEIDFVKDDIVINISLQGPSCAILWPDKLSKEEIELFNARKGRGIFIRKDGAFIYRTITGVLPPQEILKSILG
jgi:hypothetical protein